jgi:hypothetical protein
MIIKTLALLTIQIENSFHETVECLRRAILASMVGPSSVVVLAWRDCGAVCQRTRWAIAGGAAVVGGKSATKAVDCVNKLKSAQIRISNVTLS